MTTVREIMTKDPITFSKDTPMVEAARAMKEHDIGNIVVMEDGAVCGIVTDRDIVVRGIAGGQDPSSTPIGLLCTKDLVTLEPDDDVERALVLMKQNAIRRLPVVEHGKAVGFISLGDLALERDPQSVLGTLSAAPPQH
jgi:CBS domain-containing protein